MRTLQGHLFNLLITIALFGAGGYLTFQALREWEPTSVTAKELESKVPAADWLEIKHSRLVLGDRCFLYPSRSKSPDYALIPIRSREGEGGIFTHALLKTKNQEYLDPDKTLADLQDVTVTGIADRAPGADRRAAEDHYGGKLYVDFLIVEDGGKPRLLYGLLLIAAAFAATYFFYLRAPHVPYSPQISPVSSDHDASTNPNPNIPNPNLP